MSKSSIHRIKQIFFKKGGLELSIWVAGLIVCLIVTLKGGEGHLSLCPLDNLGISWCPGCGLGHSVGYMLQGNLEASFSYHPLGFLAVLIILHRIYQLTRNIRHGF